MEKTIRVTEENLKSDLGIEFDNCEDDNYEGYRICASCHMDKLEEYELVRLGMINHRVLGLCEIYKCLECNCVDIWVINKQKWCGDYDEMWSEIGIEV